MVLTGHEWLEELKIVFKEKHLNWSVLSSIASINTSLHAYYILCCGQKQHADTSGW
jgi:hypothetical protein